MIMLCKQEPAMQSYYRVHLGGRGGAETTKLKKKKSNLFENAQLMLYLTNQLKVRTLEH